LSSFLIEITAKIFRKKDPEGEGYLVDKILDKAGQKGTGKWTVQEALDLGVPVPTIAAAVDARGLSALKEERVIAAAEFGSPNALAFVGDQESFIAQVHDALYCAKIMSYAQGMAMLSAASQTYHWDLKLDEIAALWKGGCIIRARFLGDIRKAFENKPALKNLILDPGLKREVVRCVPGLRKIAMLAADRGLAIPAFAASLSYYESYRTAALPQNLTQAQRDFFGAHTYERIDKAGVALHTAWEEQ
jgi:6-phosphogluconate dehydrogenase